MSMRPVSLIAALSFALVLPVAAQQPTDHATAVKDSLQKSLAALRQYQWVETTVITLKGEQKARLQNTCYYGADGKLQKTPIVDPTADAPKKPRGIRGKVAENKKEDLSEAAKEAMALVKQYVPPDPARIQAAKAEGRLSLTPPDASGKVRLAIKDYLKAGDSLTFDVSAATDKILAVTIATFTEKEKDAVGLNVSFGAFADGTIYPAKVQLDVASQKLAVTVENAGYKKLGN